MPPSTHHAPNARLVYRVRRIPNFITKEHGPDSLSDLLARALGDYESKDIEVGSLAASASAYDEDKVATIRFTAHVPRLLDDDKGEWEIKPVNIPQKYSLLLDTHFRGFTALSDLRGTTCDCIALSGLASHPFGSWQRKDRGKDFMWIRDLLPEAVPDARVIIYGYDTPLIASNSSMTIEDLSQGLASSLRAFELGKRPLIFLAHSLGGIVFKQMIVQLAAGTTLDQACLKVICGGVCFGVPNWGIRNAHWLPMVEGRSNKELIQDLGLQSKYLMSLDDRFGGLAVTNHLRLHWAYERKSSPVTIKNGKYDPEGPEEVLVTVQSATRGLNESDPGSKSTGFAIDENHSNMVKFGPGDHVSRDVIRRVREIIEDSEHTDSTATRLDERSQAKPQQKADLLDSLSFSERDSRIKQVADNIATSFEWIFTPDLSLCDTLPGFTEWASSGTGLFWIRGKPGSGKSTLMKFLWQDKRTIDLFRISASAHYADLVFAPFFFHHRGSAVQHSYTGLLRTVLGYILQECPRVVSCLEAVAAEFELRTRDISKKRPVEPEFWTYSRLKRSLDAILEQKSFRLDLCLLFDALDEYDGQPAVIGQYLEDMVKPRPSSLTRVKICFSSRDWQDFANLFGQRPGFALQDFTARDMREYCLQTIHAADHDAPKVLGSLVPELVARSSGVFLWMKLVLDDLIKLVQADPGQDVQAVLEALPVELEDYYLSSLLRVPDRWNAFVLLELGARGLFLGFTLENGEKNSPTTPFHIWASVACSQCTTVSEAIGVIDNMLKRWPDLIIPADQTQLLVQQASAGLVEAIKARNKAGYEFVQLQLLHQSVRDLVLRPHFQRLILPKHQHTPTENGYSFAAKFALAYMTKDLTNVKDTPLLPRWKLLAGKYLRHSESTVGLSQQSYIDSAEVAGWSWTMGALHLGSTAGLLLYLRDSQRTNPRIFADHCHPLLETAHHAGTHACDVVKFILEGNYDVTKDPNAYSLFAGRAGLAVLHSRSSRPQSATYEEMAILMLKHGQPQNSPTSIAHFRFLGMIKEELPALHVAPSQLTRWLLDNGADPNERSRSGRTPLDTRCMMFGLIVLEEKDDLSSIILDFEARRSYRQFEKQSGSMEADSNVLSKNPWLTRKIRWGRVGRMPGGILNLDAVHATSLLLVARGGTAPKTSRRDIQRLRFFKPMLDWTHLEGVIGVRPPKPAS